MIQSCSADYWRDMPGVLARNGDPHNPGQPCGRTFNDVDHSTICPHEELGTAGLVCKVTDLFKHQCPHCAPGGGR